MRSKIVQIWFKQKNLFVKKKHIIFYILHTWLVGYHYHLEILISISGEEEFLKANEIKCSYEVSMKYKIIIIFWITDKFWIIYFETRRPEVTEQDPQMKERLSPQFVWICRCKNNNNNNTIKNFLSYVLCQLRSKPADRKHVTCQCHINCHSLTHIRVVSPSLEQ